MKRKTKRDVHAVLKEHARRRSIDDLAREGTKHIRVLSGDKILELLQAIVDDAVGDSGLVSEAERDRLVAESKRQFEDLARQQAGADREIAQLRQTCEEARTTLAASERERDALRTEIGQRDEQIAQLQAKLRTQTDQAESIGRHVDELQHLEGQLTTRLQTAETRAEQLAAQLAAAEQRQPDIRQMEERLATARATVESYDQEITRLLERVKEDEQIILDLRTLLGNKESELRSAEDRFHQLAVEAESTRRDAGVDTLKGELAAMRAELVALTERPQTPDTTSIEATLQTGLQSLVTELAARESKATEALEERFGATLDKTLDEIGKTVRSATAGPVDRPVEATDALIGKVFDEDGDLESNYGDIAATGTRSTTGIARNLERLRALRQGAGEQKDEAPTGR